MTDGDERHFHETPKADAAARDDAKRNWSEAKSCRPPLSFDYPNEGWSHYAAGLEQAGDELEAERDALAQKVSDIQWAVCGDFMVLAYDGVIDFADIRKHRQRLERRKEHRRAARESTHD